MAISVIQRLRAVSERQRHWIYFAGNYFFAHKDQMRPLFGIQDCIWAGRRGVRYEGNHCLGAPASRDVIEKAETAFGASFPEAYAAFLKTWNGGVLLLKEFYRILPMQEVIRENYRIRNLRGVNTSDPWKLIRFCDVGDGNYLGFDMTSGWSVVYASVEYGDQENLDTCGRYPEGASFGDWLAGMIERDGAFSRPEFGSPTYGFSENAICLDEVAG